MQFRLFIILILLFFISAINASVALSLDSILNETFHTAEIYNKKIKSFEADMYMRALVETKKKNFLYPYTNSIPNFVIHDVKNDEALIETVSKIKFRAPNDYRQDVKYVTGTLTNRRDIALLPLKFLSMDIYEESVPGETFYLPIREKTSDYYDYELASDVETDTRTTYKINYTPKYKNPKLITGYFVVEDGTWRVLNFNGNGSDLLISYTFDVEMGHDSITNLLPLQIQISQFYKYLGNHVLNKFQADLNYSDVQFNDTISNKKIYNLGPVYKVKLDSVPLNNDTVLWDDLRTFPLTGYEQLIVEGHRLKVAEAESKRNPADTLKASNRALEIAKNMVMNTRYKYKSTTFGFSGLLNPTMIGYSTYDGLTYRQKFHLNFDLDRQQSIKINAYAGYLFKSKQLQYELSGTWNYEPLKLGYVYLATGRGNPTYSSRFLSFIQDSTLNHLDQRDFRYRNYYFKIFNSIEISNGLQLGTGIDYHIRQPIHPEILLSSIGLLETQYHFVPKVSISWTPGQYYVTDGFQKMYVRSDFPTFKVEYAQSLKNVWRGNSSYSRVEFDISQNVRFDFMRKMEYHAGVGFFVNQQDEYFNDFTYFAKNYFPETWGDGIGGGFNTLPNRTYNSSEIYAQAHLMYETPRFLLTRLPFLSHGVARERIYLSQLYLPPVKKSFTEVGYGIGNRFLNAAMFVAFDGLKYYNIGGKAVFLL